MKGSGHFSPVSLNVNLPVGSVVFVSHRLKRVVFRVCKVLGKKYLAPGGRREDFLAKPERLDLAKS